MGKRKAEDSPGEAEANAVEVSRAPCAGRPGVGAEDRATTFPALFRVLSRELINILPQCPR